MNPATLPPEAAEYLERLERELSDLPPDERAGLLEEVEASLLEGGEELGDPTRFAAELRASAGLPPAATAPRPRPSAWQRLKAHPFVRASGRVAGELRPLWWVARGVAALELLAIVIYDGLVFPHSTEAVAIFALAIAVSIGIGLASYRRHVPFRGLRIATDLVLALVCLAFVPMVVREVRNRLDQTTVVTQSGTVAGLAYDGNPIQNVYPYDRHGHLLRNVRLYDQDGQPLDVGRGFADRYRRPPHTKDGTTVYNAFPIRWARVVTHTSPLVAQLRPKPLNARR